MAEPFRWTTYRETREDATVRVGCLEFLVASLALRVGELSQAPIKVSGNQKSRFFLQYH